MKLSEIIKSSFATLRLNGRRTFLTMIGIIIGIAAVITILSLGNGSRQSTINALTKDDKGRLSQDFYYTPSPFEEKNKTHIHRDNPYSQDKLQAIEEMEGVDEVMVDTQYAVETFYPEVTLTNQKRYDEIAFVEQTDLEMVVGRNLTMSDNESGLRYIVISEEVARDLFGSPELAYQQGIELDHRSYTVVGVFKESDSQLEISFGIPDKMPTFEVGYIPYETYLRYYDLPEDTNYLKVFFKDNVDMKGISQQIQGYLNDHAPEGGTYNYFDISEMMQEINSALNQITVFISSVAAISLFIAGVGVMNMMYISVAERTKEIGIRRSLGATKRAIQTQFLLEGIAITTLGGVIGYFSGIALAFFIAQFLPFSAILDVKTALGTVLVSVTIGIVFSVFPARTAAKKNVVEILR
ncbi:ABC transporter permease [Dolosicoccus paucivorans]|uniref:ABC transporter permease n=1 Tax=Dolosicoccus paucivorans TaxID=84521 RepID=A0A2N6SNK3_9LACT|nr:ABC transporter permease [Dolosicoccus paucivorans]PMB83629.1 ABC transporter permease [Dolosicoccus paucivorans]PMC58657.1 ABC transporter permease [Dolosicoccus paucivorans]